MKHIFIFSFFLSISLMSCSTSKNAQKDQLFHIVQAGYHHYSQPPARGASLPEKGTNLAVIVKNWPHNAQPVAIIYNHRKSFKPEFSDTTEAGVALNARIIRSSSVFHPFSAKVEKSDRLIYQTADGKKNYITIKKWTRIPNIK